MKIIFDDGKEIEFHISVGCDRYGAMDNEMADLSLVGEPDISPTRILYEKLKKRQKPILVPAHLIEPFADIARELTGPGGNDTEKLCRWLLSDPFLVAGVYRIEVTPKQHKASLRLVTGK
jgi:hypothetical protein